MHSENAPQREYRARIAARRARVRSHDRRYSQIAIARLMIAVAAGLCVWLIFWQGLLAPGWLLLPPAAFLCLMAIHARVAQLKRQAQRAVNFYDRGLARLEDRWAGTGDAGSVFADEQHLYTADLDIFGPGSIFELLSTCRTVAGRATLARWLQQPGTKDTIVARQQAVSELRDALNLREDLATIGPDLDSTIALKTLITWATAPRTFAGTPLGRALIVLPVIVGAAWLYGFVSGWVWAYYAGLLGQGLFFLVIRKRVQTTMEAAELPQKELELASELIVRLENIHWSSPKLQDLGATFGQGSGSASAQIRRLVRMVERQKAFESANGPLTILLLFLTGMLMPLSVVLLVSPRAAWAIEDWRETHGSRVEAWISAIGEFEALMALSGYAYERPSDPFPEIIEGPAILKGQDLAHPLLPAATAVANSLRLDQTQQLIVVSGSNMSGKSTLLRTVGVNVVMALAGAPVRAQSLRVSPLTIGATLRVQDSLATGTSRFYAEITRIRAIMDRTSADIPVLFLLDEVLHGTNSRDRAIGAAGIVRGLIDQGAIGLATTHDLALTQVADALGDRAINVHFDDHMKNNKMDFDYTMKSGVIEKSNALELMRALGLDV